MPFPDSNSESAVAWVRRRGFNDREFFRKVENSGYNLARCGLRSFWHRKRLRIYGLKANIRSAVRDALETHLRHEPTKTSRSRIKRLRGLARPQYRLRVGEIRIFYDISSGTVEVLAIVQKSEATKWLEQFGSLQ
jgi:mRNA-degrading endonuclease RelE of RelBE toxin-antitoxin system